MLYPGFPNGGPAWGEAENTLKMMITEAAPQGSGLLARKCPRRIIHYRKRRLYGKKVRARSAATRRKD